MPANLTDSVCSGRLPVPKAVDSFNVGSKIPSAASHDLVIQCQSTSNPNSTSCTSVLLCVNKRILCTIQSYLDTVYTCILHSTR